MEYVKQEKVENETNNNDNNEVNDEDRQSSPTATTTIVENNEENTANIKNTLTSNVEHKSTREALEARLKSLKEQISQVNEEIKEIKIEKGWYTNITSYTTADDTYIELWNKIIEKENFYGGVFGSPSKQVGRVKTRGVKRERNVPITSHKKYYGNSGNNNSANVVGGSSKSLRTAKVQVSVKERRVEAIWQQCMTILNTVRKHKYAWPFLEPVDPVLLNLPDYLEIIDKPMDLGTITKKIENDPKRNITRLYKSPLEFRNDMRQVWTNCRIYNKPGQDVRLMGDTLSEFWEKKWCLSEIEEKWCFEEQHPNPNEDVTWISNTVLSITGHSHVLLPSGDIPMSFADKRKLAHQIGLLNGKQLLEVVQMLSATISIPEDENGELILDLEELNNETLWKLKRYVDSLTVTIKKPVKITRMLSKMPRTQTIKKGADDMTEEEMSVISDDLTN